MRDNGSTYSYRKVFRDDATGFIFKWSLYVSNNSVLTKILLLWTLSIDLTKSMEQSPRESNSSWDSQKIHRTVCNPTVYCRVKQEPVTCPYPECCITLGFVQHLSKPIPIAICRAKGYYGSNLQGFRYTGLIANKTGNVTMGRVRVNLCCRWKAINVVSSECVSVALVIRHVNRILRRIILSSAACLTEPSSSTLSHKRHDIRGGGITEHKMCVLIFSTIMPEIFFTPTKITHDVIINVHNCKLLLSDFNQTWIFLANFRKIIHYKFYENPSEGNRSDMTKVMIAFRNFVKAPINSHSEILSLCQGNCEKLTQIRDRSNEIFVSDSPLSFQCQSCRTKLKCTTEEFKGNTNAAKGIGKRMWQQWNIPNLSWPRSRWLSLVLSTEIITEGATFCDATDIKNAMEELKRLSQKEYLQHL